MSKARNLSDFISDAAIDATEIGSNAVTTDKIIDQAVTPAKLHNTLDLSSKTVTLPTGGISGNAINGGVISNFASTGIDDNASSTAVTILSDGKVGIGTSSPTEKLDVSESIAVGLNIKGTGGTTTLYNPSGAMFVRGGTGNKLSLGANNTNDLMVIDSSGNVSIGAGNAPSERLQIGGNIRAGNTGSTTSFDGGGNDRYIGVSSLNGGDAMFIAHASGYGVAYFGYEATDDKLIIACDNGSGNNKIDFSVNAGANANGATDNLSGITPAMRIAASGNVGIGTTNPQAKLHVSGNVLIEGGSTDSRTLGFTNSSGSTGWSIGNGIIDSTHNFRIYDNTAGAARLTVDGNGNTGIRSSNPQATLEVYGFIRAGKNSARLNASVHSYSSRHNTVRTPENLYNGYINYEEFGGILDSDWLTASNQRDNAYVVLDLGDSKSINRAVIYNQNEYQDSSREVKRFILQGTNDVNNANSWVTVLDDVMGKSGAHEPNPGYSFRIPAGNQTSVKNDPVDDNEAVSYRYWKFIMKDFWASDSYGGIMEIELYEYAVSVDGRQDEISSNSMVATDVYAQTLAATGDINLIGQAQVNYNYHPVPSTMAPHSIPGLSSYLDMQHSYRYPRSGSGVDRYTLADLGNEPMSWTLRNENAANLSNSHMVNNITGVVDGRYSMKTGSNAAGGGVASTNQDRYHMMTYDGPTTFVWIVMRGNGGGINSNESLLTQNTNASSYGYQIIRHYPSYANIYSYNGQSQNISYPSGYSTAVASQKWFLIAHQYWDTNQQSVTFFDNNYPNGNQQTSTANYDWRWNANANTRKLVLGGSEWGSYGEGWGQGSSGSSQYGAIGAFMYYKNSLSTYDLKTIFDYYRNHYDMG